MVQGCIGTHPLTRISLEHGTDPIFGRLRNVIPNLIIETIIARGNPLYQVLLVLAHEWRRASKDEIRDDSDGPEVA